MHESSSSSKVLVAVQIDRCWNRHWRLLLFLGAVAMSCITGAMWMSMQRARINDNLLNTEWKNHWAPGQNKQSASKTVFEQSSDQGRGIGVKENEETFQDYAEENKDPMPDNPEYYDEDRPDVRKPRLDQDYVQNYEDEVRQSAVNKSRTSQLISALTRPELRDYSLKAEFYNPFKRLLENMEDIEFDNSYDNPCWAESVPRFPYLNNSYLMVSEQARIIEPMFQGMRKKFARQDQNSKWRLRCLPAFYVMETPPLATPSLFTVLGYHPSVVTPHLPEPEYWNQKGPDNVASFKDYLDLFDAAAHEIRENVTIVVNEGKRTPKHTKLTGDGTSSYLWTFDSWKKVKANEGLNEPKVTAADFIFKLTPLAKLIFVLRNPTERLFQGYLSRTDSPTPADFHEKAGAVMDKITKCQATHSLRSCLYNGALNKNLPVRLRIGMYYPFISDWLRVFPSEQVKFIRYEDYVASPSQIINEVCNFLGLPPFPTNDLALVEQRVMATEAKRKSNQIKMLSTTKAMLKEFHSKLNQELAALADNDKFTWPELATPLDASSDVQQTDQEKAEKERQEREKKQKIQDAIREMRKQQVESQQRRMAEYREKLKKWSEEQRERRKQQGGQQQPDQQQQPGQPQTGQQQQPGQQQQQPGQQQPGQQQQGGQQPFGGQRSQEQQGRPQSEQPQRRPDQQPGEPQRRPDQQPGEPQRRPDQQPGERQRFPGQRFRQLEQQRSEQQQPQQQKPAEQQQGGQASEEERRRKLRQSVDQNQQQVQKPRDDAQAQQPRASGDQQQRASGDQQQSGRRIGVPWSQGKPPMGQPPQQ